MWTTLVRCRWRCQVAMFPLAAFLGCGGVATGEDATARSEMELSEQPTQLSFVCSPAQAGLFPIDAAEVTPYLPPGFTPVAFHNATPFGHTPIPAPPPESAAVQLIAFTCTPSQGGLPPEPMSLLLAWLYADAPDELEDPFLGPTPPAPHPYVVVPWLVVDQEAAVSRLQAWGLPAFHGTVSLGMEADQLGATYMGNVAAQDGSSAVQLDTLLPANQEVAEGERIRMFGVSGGSLTGIVDLIEGYHEHRAPGEATVAVQGSSGFPVPALPGVGIHGWTSYEATWALIEMP